MKKILITGANGFIGQKLIEKLRKDYDVYGLDRFSISNLDEKHSYIIDLGNFNKIGEMFKKIKPDILIHLAAIVHKNNADTSEKNYNFINYECSKYLFDTCIKYNAKIIFFSTIEVYGDNTPLIIDEETPCSPTSFYAKSKYQAEQYLRSLSNIEYSILRLTPVYDREFTLNVDKRVYLKKDKLAYYFKKGEYTFDFCSINNICNFIRYLCGNSLNNTVYLLSDKESLSAKEIININKMYKKIYTIRMPYFACLLFIKVIELTLGFFSKKDIFLSRRNFQKIFLSRKYVSSKAQKLVSFDWNYKNTLYGETE